MTPTEIERDEQDHLSRHVDHKRSRPPAPGKRMRASHPRRCSAEPLTRDVCLGRSKWDGRHARLGRKPEQCARGCAPIGVGLARRPRFGHPVSRFFFGGISRGLRNACDLSRFP